MKLSQAIRAGALGSKALKGYNLNVEKGEVCTCALGAAFLGIANSQLIEYVEGLAFAQWGGGDQEIDRELNRYFGTETFGKTVALPPEAKLEGPIRVELAIIVLNDDLGWSREKIADYLEGLGF